MALSKPCVVFHTDYRPRPHHAVAIPTGICLSYCCKSQGPPQDLAHSRCSIHTCQTNEQIPGGKRPLMPHSRGFGRDSAIPAPWHERGGWGLGDGRRGGGSLTLTSRSQGATGCSRGVSPSLTRTRCDQYDGRWGGGGDRRPLQKLGAREQTSTPSRPLSRPPPSSLG